MLLFIIEILIRKKENRSICFVIMPNHVHFIWQMLEMNGKEMPHVSFLKFTAHAFKKHLKLHAPKRLTLFAVDAINKDYQFWQRDSLAFELLKKETILQKIDYIPARLIVPVRTGTGGQAGITIQLLNIGSYVMSQLIINIPLQNSMKRVLMTLDF